MARPDKQRRKLLRDGRKAAEKALARRRWLADTGTFAAIALVAVLGACVFFTLKIGFDLVYQGLLSDLWKQGRFMDLVWIAAGALAGAGVVFGCGQLWRKRAWLKQSSIWMLAGGAWIGTIVVAAVVAPTTIAVAVFPPALVCGLLFVIACVAIFIGMECSDVRPSTMTSLLAVAAAGAVFGAAVWLIVPTQTHPAVSTEGRLGQAFWQVLLRLAVDATGPGTFISAAVGIAGAIYLRKLDQSASKQDPIPGPDARPARQQESTTEGESTASGRLTLVLREFAVFAGVLVLVLLGCLIAMGKFIGHARWFGITDYTFVYLAGSIAVGLVEIVGVILSLRSRGRLTPLTNWLAGITVVWIPVCGGIALGFLPNSLPKWLAISYLGFFLLQLPLIWFHRDLLKRAVFGDEMPLDQYPTGSKWGAAIGGTFHLAFTAACGVLWVMLTIASHRVDASLDALVADVDKVEQLLKEAEDMSPALIDASLAVEQYQKVVDRLEPLTDTPLSKQQTDKLAAILARGKELLAKSSDLMKKSHDAKVAKLREASASRSNSDGK